MYFLYSIFLMRAPGTSICEGDSISVARTLFYATLNAVSSLGRERDPLLHSSPYPLCVAHLPELSGILLSVFCVQRTKKKGFPSRRIESVASHPLCTRQDPPSPPPPPRLCHLDFLSKPCLLLPKNWWANSRGLLFLCVLIVHIGPVGRCLRQSLPFCKVAKHSP